MQSLKIFQSLWGMELRNPNQPERTHEQSFAMIAEAGYHGVCLDPGPDEIEESLALQPLFERHGLACMLNAFPYTPNDMAPLLDLAVTMRAKQVNVISGVMPRRPEDAVPVVRRWIAEAAPRGIPLLFETHRDGLLNDLYYTLDMMALVPEMRLCADLSHFVVDREMRLPLVDRDRDWMRDVLLRSDCFQGRVANREQVQVQIDFPQHQAWVAQFRDWWRLGIEAWRARSDDDAELIFLCELGPPPYAITDAQQNELSDRWAEALQIREWVEAIWEACRPDSV